MAVRKTSRSKLLNGACVLVAIAVVGVGSFTVGRESSSEQLDTAVATTIRPADVDPTVDDEAAADDDAGDQPDDESADVTGRTPQPGEDEDFVETFEGNAGFDRFDRGGFHRGVDFHGFEMEARGESTWMGDHDENCGDPGSQRVLDKVDREGSFYTCRDHLMTSVGHVDSYSLAWFSPNQTFTTETTDTVSWDVNSTFLGSRQWWEVTLVPVDFDSGQANCRHCTAEVGAADIITSADDHDILRIGGPSGGDQPQVNGVHPTFVRLCNPGVNALDQEGCDSKPIRRTWTIVDNRNGTVTLSFLDNEWTFEASFPDGEFVVMFKDHNYTPDKSCGQIRNNCPGYTWHWDNIIVT